jgi:predicted MFS family arabinose efflux permease
VAYGIVQALAPAITGGKSKVIPGRNAAVGWALLLSMVTAILAYLVQLQWQLSYSLIIGLLLFGFVFAINSSLHSFLVVSYASEEGVSMDVGFYYMANAMGRLLGTVLSGWVFQQAGLSACLWVSFAMLLGTSLISLALPQQNQGPIARPES